MLLLETYNISENKVKILTYVNYTRRCVFCQIFLEKTYSRTGAIRFLGHLHVRFNTAIVKELRKNVNLFFRVYWNYTTTHAWVSRFFEKTRFVVDRGIGYKLLVIGFWLKESLQMC